ncbi:MAG TPA: SAM-dependent chlorinase/fluorinase [Verrucomicrobiae bacterium]|nr:SAM-dependent chlorinase/fluorinase [Verrucomicrobiae bacterium]
MHTITLTTDFGVRDWFVGTMKGVVLGINPRAVIVDLTHEIPAGDIRAGAFALMAACRFFSKGTVHVAVVDPGVGSQRRALAVQTANYLFVGPDNGVLSWALAREKIKTVRQLENPKYFLETISRTFHGRDIFAPVAAHLSRGLPLERLGRELKDFVHLPWPKPTQRRGEIRGEIVHLDHFGNALTNIEAELLPAGRKVKCEVMGKREVHCALGPFYGAVPANSPVAVIGSSGFLEIAVNGGSAAKRFGLRTGDAAIVRAN